MDDKKELLEVVDENDKVIGIESRVKIHKEGLLHREIHVWFITPNGEIIFQHRSKNKDTYPDKLDATVGGHVEPGMSYQETAIKECKEETGIDIDVKDLVFLDRMNSKSFDVISGKMNNTLRSYYAYLYSGPIDNLIPEEGQSQGFEAWKIEDLSNLSKEDKDKFILMVLDGRMITLFDKARKLLLK